MSFCREYYYNHKSSAWSMPTMSPLLDPTDARSQQPPIARSLSKGTSQQLTSHKQIPIPPIIKLIKIISSQPSRSLLTSCLIRLKLKL